MNSLEEYVPLNRHQVREVDRIAIEEYRIPGIILMEHAALGCVQFLMSCSTQEQITIVCGSGNNAGDGFAIARLLFNQGLKIQVVVLTDPDRLTGDAMINFTIIQKMNLPCIQYHDDSRNQIEQTLANSTWIVDAMLGTGAQGVLRAPYNELVSQINLIRKQNSDCNVLAIDLPTGLDCDTGNIMGTCLRADDTTTFVAPKPGFFINQGPEYVGNIHVIDIGVPQEVVDRVQQSRYL